MCDAAITALGTATGVAFDGTNGGVVIAGSDACGAEIEATMVAAKEAADALGLGALVPDAYSDGYHIGIKY